MRSFEEKLAVMPFLVRHPIAAAGGLRVNYTPQSVNGRRYCNVWTLNHPIENALGLVKFGENGGIGENIIRFWLA